LNAVWKEIGRTALKLLGSLIVITFVIFLLTDVIPGSPARAVLGKSATPGEIAAFERLHGLDNPLWQQYWDYLTSIFRGQLGTSFGGATVSSLVVPRLIRTFYLVLMGWLLAGLIAVPLGLWSGRRSGRASDTTVSFGTLAVGATPEFMIGLLLLFLLADKAGLFPTDSSAAGFHQSPWSDFSAYVLPAIAIALTIIPYITRLARANSREVMGEPYIRSAVLRGIGGSRLTGRHVLPNAAPPVVVALALQFAGSIGGVVVTETVFGFPGIGQLLVNAVGDRDIPVVQAIALIIGGTYVIINVVADAVVRAVTPRTRVVQA
jgi:peptide/nickel transport system permease protein